jgi:Zinc knuckle
MGQLADLQDECRRRRMEVLELITQLKTAIAELVTVSGNFESAVQALISGAVEEIDEENGGKGRKSTPVRVDNPPAKQDHEEVSPTGRKRRACSNCGGHGHWAKNCQEPSKPIVPLGKKACSICRQPGHRATTCPKKKK